MNKEIERIRALSDAFGPSGFEDEVADLVESRKISMICMKHIVIICAMSQLMQSVKMESL